MPPVHDYPQGIAKTNCKNLYSVDYNKSAEHDDPVPPSNPHIEEESWTTVVWLFLLGIAITALSAALSLLHFLYFDYMMRRQGLELW